MPENPAFENLYFGKEIQTFDSLSSTNSRLKELAAKSQLPEGFAVQAKYQTSGRGQLGNVWHSERGQNLLFSILLRPNWLKTEHLFRLNMSVCLALVDALNSFRPGFLVKWPNDVLYDESKVAGILIENTLAQNSISESTIGIGLNVNQQRFPESLPKAISLCQILGRPVPLAHIFKVVLQKMQLRYFQIQDNPKRCKSDYLKHLFGFQSHQNDGIWTEIDGQKKLVFLKNVLPNGQLVAELEGGEQKFNFKEINLLP